MNDIEIAKRGENIFNLSFRRLNGRVRVHVKAHPSIEELLKSWGAGVSSPIIDFGGRNWIFEGPSPEVWDLDERYARDQSYGDGYFTLGLPGHDLYQERDGLARGPSVQPLVNISFLRIVGISHGTEFELAGVHSMSYLLEVQQKIQKAVKRVYQDYLLPIDLTVQLNTQETRL